MTTTGYLFCGLISCVILITFSKELFVDVDFGDCLLLALTIILLFLMGPIGLVLVSLAALIKGISWAISWFF